MTRKKTNVLLLGSQLVFMGFEESIIFRVSNPMPASEVHIPLSSYFEDILEGVPHHEHRNLCFFFILKAHLLARVREMLHPFLTCMIASFTVSLLETWKCCLCFLMHKLSQVEDFPSNL